MSRDVRTAAVIAVCLFGIYNANGREIATYDSQATKFAARELLLRGTLSLNHVVGKTPELGNRAAFVQTRTGRYRSAYSPIPAIIAAALTWPFWETGLVDIRAARAPALMAAVTSAMMVSFAVALAYLVARQHLSETRSMLLAAGLGLGTGLWPTASQTLWQHETRYLRTRARGVCPHVPGTRCRPVPRRVAGPGPRTGGRRSHPTGAGDRRSPHRNGVRARGAEGRCRGSLDERHLRAHPRRELPLVRFRSPVLRQSSRHCIRPCTGRTARSC